MGEIKKPQFFQLVCLERFEKLNFCLQRKLQKIVQAFKNVDGGTGVSYPAPHKKKIVTYCYAHT